MDLNTDVFQKIYHKVQGNGLGDQLLDVLGGMVMSTLLGKTEHAIIWKTRPQTHSLLGVLLYDQKLFDFTNLHLQVEILDEPLYETTQHQMPTYLELVFPSPSASSSPRRLQKWLQERLQEQVLSVEECIDLYCRVAQNIKPSDIVKPFLLDIKEGQNVTGIHLRYTEKVIEHNTTDDVHVEISEYDEAMSMTLQFVIAKSFSNPNDAFFICGDNQDILDRFKECLLIANKDINIVNPPKIDENTQNQYLGIADVRDMFCLSQCELIVQTVGYSTFSLLASLIGDKPMINHWVGHGRTLQYMWLKQTYPLTEYTYNVGDDLQLQVCNIDK